MEKLLNSHLFSGMDLEQIHFVLQGLKKIEFEKGDILMSQGEEASQVYLLTQGKVEIFYESENQRTLLAYVNAPVFLGHLEVWSDDGILGTVRALSSGEGYCMSKTEYFQLLHSHHQLAINIVKILSKMAHKVGKDRMVLFFGKVENIMAKRILSLSKYFGVQKDRGMVIEKVTKSDLSELTGISRKSVIQAINSLSEKGLVVFEGKEILIPDTEALKKLVYTF